MNSEVFTSLASSQHDCDNFKEAKDKAREFCRKREAVIVLIYDQLKTKLWFFHDDQPVSVGDVEFPYDCPN